MGGCSQSIPDPFCLSFLLTLFPAPAWDLHGLQGNTCLSTALHRTAFCIQVWTSDTLSADTYSPCKLLINCEMQLWGSSRKRCLMRLSSFPEDGFSYPARVVRVGDVAAGSCTHRSSIDARCSVWCQQGSVQSWGRRSHAGVQGLNQHISLDFLNPAFLPMCLFNGSWNERSPA